MLLHTAIVCDLLWLVLLFLLVSARKNTCISRRGDLLIIGVVMVNDPLVIGLPGGRSWLHIVDHSGRIVVLMIFVLLLDIDMLRCRLV